MGNGKKPRIPQGGRGCSFGLIACQNPICILIVLTYAVLSSLL